MKFDPGKLALIGKITVGEKPSVESVLDQHIANNKATVAAEQAAKAAAPPPAPEPTPAPRIVQPGPLSYYMDDRGVIWRRDPYAVKILQIDGAIKQWEIDTILAALKEQ